MEENLTVNVPFHDDGDFDLVLKLLYKRKKINTNNLRMELVFGFKLYCTINLVMFILLLLFCNGFYTCVLLSKDIGALWHDVSCKRTGYRM